MLANSFLCKKSQCDVFGCYVVETDRGGLIGQELLDEKLMRFVRFGLYGNANDSFE